MIFQDRFLWIIYRTVVVIEIFLTFTNYFLKIIYSYALKLLGYWVFQFFFFSFFFINEKTTGLEKTSFQLIYTRLYKKLVHIHFCSHLHCARLRHFLISCSFASLLFLILLGYTSPHSSSFFLYSIDANHVDYKKQI